MQTRLSIITSSIADHEISHLYTWKVDIQWNSFGLNKKPDNGHLRPKHVVKWKSDGNSYIVEGIILCVRVIFIRSVHAQIFWDCTFSKQNQRKEPHVNKQALHNTWAPFCKSWNSPTILILEQITLYSLTFWPVTARLSTSCLVPCTAVYEQVLYSSSAEVKEGFYSGCPSPGEPTVSVGFKGLVFTNTCHIFSPSVFLMSILIILLSCLSCRIWGSHSSCYDYICLQGYNAV
jgi:hypothetical protein